MDLHPSIYLGESMSYSVYDAKMKNYELPYKKILPSDSYVVLRLDGKAFHSYTKGREKPFDAGLQLSMVSTSNLLLREIQGARLAYTQSDEISILIAPWDPDSEYSRKSEMWMGGKDHKLLSLSAAMASVHFNKVDGDKSTSDRPALFDSRIMVFPGTDHGKNTVSSYFNWRFQDCRRNSISSAAQAQFSSKSLHRKNSFDQREMLREVGTPWEDYPNISKFGTLSYLDYVEFNNDDGTPFYRGQVHNISEELSYHSLNEYVPLPPLGSSLK